MLTDQIKELLTAFVDGELNQRQRKAVMRLLERSSEARELVRQLQENAHRIKQLPPHKVEPSLVEEVMQAIAERKSQPKQPILMSKRARRRWLPYVAATLAASLLIATIAGLYWKSMSDLNQVKPDEGIVKIDKKNEPQPPVPTPTPAPTPRKATPNPLVAQMVGGAFEEFIKPVPAPPPTVFAFRELLNAGEKADQLARAVADKNSVQFDITVKDNFVAMDRLKSALSAHKIDIVSDPKTAKALKDKKKVEYWVFVENLTPDELTKMMQELSKNDTTGKVSSIPTPYEKVAVKPITKNETKKIAGLLGVEPSKLELPKNNDTKPAPLKDWRKAVLLPLSAGARPSAQVGEFVNQRRTSQAGTLQVLIKIHQEK